MIYILIFFVTFTRIFSVEFSESFFRLDENYDIIYEDRSKSYFSTNTDFNKIQLCSFLNQISKVSSSFFEFNNISVDQITEEHVHGCSSVGFYRLDLDKSYFIKLYADMDLTLYSIFKYQKFVSDVLYKNDMPEGFPSLLQSKYQFLFRDNTRILVVQVFPYIKGQTYWEICNMGLNNATEIDSVKKSFYALGKAFALFHSYFMDAGLITRTHPEPSEHNLMIDNMNTVHFLDYYGSKFLNNDEEVGAAFLGPIRYYWRAFRSGKFRNNMKLFIAILTSYYHGYIEAVDEKVIPRVNEAISDMIGRSPKRKNVLNQILSKE